MNKAADVVKRRRLALALTQPELARKSRLRLSQVADLENGRGKLSRILLRRLAHALDLDRRLLMPLAHTKAKLPDLPGVPLVLSGDLAQMWRRFLKDQILRSRYHITRREIQALKNSSLLGLRYSARILDCSDADPRTKHGENRGTRQRRERL